MFVVEKSVLITTTVAVAVAVVAIQWTTVAVDAIVAAAVELVRFLPRCQLVAAAVNLQNMQLKI